MDEIFWMNELLVEWNNEWMKYCVDGWINDDSGICGSIQNDAVFVSTCWPNGSWSILFGLTFFRMCPGRALKAPEQNCPLTWKYLSKSIMYLQVSSCPSLYRNVNGLYFEVTSEQQTWSKSSVNIAADSAITYVIMEIHSRFVF